VGRGRGACEVGKMKVWWKVRFDMLFVKFLRRTLSRCVWMVFHIYKRVTSIDGFIFSRNYPRSREI
jgi:hypothetical protein